MKDITISFQTVSSPLKLESRYSTVTTKGLAKGHKKVVLVASGHRGPDLSKQFRTPHEYAQIPW